jgi:RNA polymerase sigma-70 factor (ECF subfamily)
MPTPSELVLPHLPEDHRAAAGALDGLDALLERIVADARTAWPELSLDDASFLRHVAERLGRSAPFDQALERIHAADLYLACACSKGAEGAVAAFEKRFSPGIRASLARFAPQDVVEEVCQQLLAKLFASDPPHIDKYEGRGELAAWVQISATRDAYKVLGRQKGRQSEIDALADLAIEVDDPELEGLKQAYRAHFKRAFQVAFQELEARDRNILRLEYLDGLNIDRIGAMYGVHRATVARWRTQARTALFKRTRKVFEAELAVGGRDFDSIVRLIESQLEVSLDRLLDGD